MSNETQSTREILRKVRQIEIRTRRQVSDALAGAYRSAFKGTGIDFEEVREYFPGDDVRSIDWNVTAKMDKPFVKRFREERELTLLLAVDLSASGEFGSADASKRERAAELASVLALSATRNNDKVGLLLFTDKVEKYIPPKKGRQHVLRVIREILFFQPEQSGTDLVLALDTINHVLRRHAIVFFLSDFLTDETLAWIRPAPGGSGQLSRALKITNRRHDLVALVLEDPREQELPDIGLVTLEDAETGELVEIDTGNRKVRELYQRQNAKRRTELGQTLRRAGIDYLTLSTSGPYLPTLRQFFAVRQSRR